MACQPLRYLPPDAALTASAAAFASSSFAKISSSGSSGSTSSRLKDTSGSLMSVDSARIPTNLHRASNIRLSRSSERRVSTATPSSLGARNSPKWSTGATYRAPSPIASTKSISFASAAASSSDLASSALSCDLASAMHLSTVSMSSRSFLWCGTASSYAAWVSFANAAALSSIAVNVASCASFVATAAWSTRASRALYSSQTSGEYSPPFSRVLRVSAMNLALDSSVAVLFRSA